MKIIVERTSSYAPLALQIYARSLMLMVIKVEVTRTSHIPGLTQVCIHLSVHVGMRLVLYIVLHLMYDVNSPLAHSICFSIWISA